MIILGNKKIRIVNPAQIIHLEMTKGKTTAFIKGDTDGDKIKVKNISVREPWTVVVRTPIETHYINHKDFECALNCVLGLCRRVDSSIDMHTLERDLRKVYGQEKEKESK